MKPPVLLRVASVLTLIFCAGHTYGTLGSSSADPEQAAVFMAMQAYPFEIMGARRTHWQFYRGFSLLFSVTLLLLAVLLWQLARLSNRDPAGASGSSTRSSRSFTLLPTHPADTSCRCFTPGVAR